MVEGKYVANGIIMGTEMESHIDYHVDGNSLTGTMSVQDNVIEVLNGTVDGDNFKHMCQVPSPIGEMRVKIEGSVNGDEINFIIKNPMGKSAFKGKRI